MQKVIDPRRQRWMPYVRKIADIYGLKDWILEVDNDGPTDRLASASIYCTPGRKYGYIRLSQYFLDENSNDQRLAIVHELTHCHTHMAHSFGTDHLISDETKATFTTLLEYGIDGIAVAIASFFPLPSIEHRGA